MTFKAAILTAHKAPLELWDVSHEFAGHDRHCANGQVRVEMIMSGICGAQLGEWSGSKNPDAPMPRMIGHEGVGIVREVGAGVSVQMIGKRVVCHWRKGDGPEATLPARYSVGNGKTIGGGHITTLAESVVISANRATVVPDSVPDEVAALLGCSLSTALGTIEHEAKLKFGESVLVMGCGGVGLNLIIAAKAAGAGRIAVADRDSDKAKLAYEAGATSFESPRKMTGEKFDVIIDTTGSVEVLESTIPMLSGTGRFILLGQTKPGECFRVTDAVNRFYGQGAHLIWSQGGGFNPTQDLPRYVALWETGRLNLDAVVSHRLPLSEINTAFELVRSGQAGRIMIHFPKCQ